LQREGAICVSNVQNVGRWSHRPRIGTGRTSARTASVSFYAAEEREDAALDPRRPGDPCGELADPQPVETERNCRPPRLARRAGIDRPFPWVQGKNEGESDRRANARPCVARPALTLCCFLGLPERRRDDNRWGRHSCLPKCAVPSRQTRMSAPPLLARQQFLPHCSRQTRMSAPLLLGRQECLPHCLSADKNVCPTALP